MNPYQTSDELVRHLVMKILSNALSYPWTVQGFGMLRTYLENNVRLTLWLKKYRTPAVSMLHTHPWDFNSYIVCGEMHNTVFKTVYDHGEPGFPYWVQKIKAGEGGGLEGEPERVKIAIETQDYIKTEGRYDQTFNQIHRSDPADGTVTLCARQVPEGNSKDHALVFWPDGYAWVSAEPCPATPEIISDFVAAALVQMRLVYENQV
jgi:hypothetical protein